MLVRAPSPLPPPLTLHEGQVCEGKGDVLTLHLGENPQFFRQQHANKSTNLRVNLPVTV
jgi:hypothetical protein